MRIRLPELMRDRGITNAHALSKASGGRIPITTAYRLIETEGSLDRISHILEALCDVLQVTPGELFERDGETAAKTATKKATKPQPKKSTRKRSTGA